MQCVNLLGSDVDAEMLNLWLNACRESYSSMTAEKQAIEGEAAKAEMVVVSQIDDMIDFPHLRAKKGMSQVELEAQVENDLANATGAGADLSDEKSLNRIIQLTGFSDPVFAEAYVTVHQYDIVLDVTVSNRTEETLQNLCLELATMGDLKLVERPQNYALAPGATKSIRANIKVSPFFPLGFCVETNPYVRRERVNYTHTDGRRESEKERQRERCPLQ